MSAPDAGELQPTSRADLAGLLGDVELLEGLFALWNEDQRGAVDAYRCAIEALYAEAFRRLVRSLKSDPAALRAMKGAAADEVVYAVLRRHNIIKPSLNERVDRALASVRPMLAAHGGDFELVSIEPPAVSIRFLGACDGCNASAITFQEGVERAIREACPEIQRVTLVKGASPPGAVNAAGLVSPFDLSRHGTWRRAGVIHEIPDGGVKTVEIDGARVLLSRAGDTVTCFDDACAHLGMPLHDGRVEQGVLECPHHGFQFDLSNGECLTAPSVRLQARAVRLVGDRVEVRVER